MNFNYAPIAYYHAMDAPMVQPAEKSDIERSIKFPTKGVGKSVTEGRAGGGTFLDTLKSAIWEGAGQVELSTQMEGQEPFVGAESYGKTGREELKKMAEINQVNLTSVHSPSNIGNLSGYAGPDRGFDDTFREMAVNEIKKAIEFAADVNAPAVVVHTGEYNRPIEDKEWAKDPETGMPMFRHYEEESERAVLPLVDKRTGRLLSQVRKNQLVPRAVWERYEKGNPFWEKYNGKPYFNEETGQWVKPGDYIDYEGNKIDDPADRVPKFDRDKNEFVVKNYVWEDFVLEARERNEREAQKRGLSYEEFKKRFPEVFELPEETFLKATTETQEKIAEGWAGVYTKGMKERLHDLEKVKKALKFYKKVERNVPEEERWKIKQEVLGLLSYREAAKYIPNEYKLPSEILEDALFDIRQDIEQRRQMVLGQRQQAQEARNIRDNAIAVSKYAKQKSINSYASLGIFAMKVSKEKKLKRPVFVAAEHIWPEMGYGSHPEELIELVHESRKKMVDYLTKKKIEDPSGATYTSHDAKRLGDESLEGKPKMIDNPYYDPKLSKKQAEKLASQHIKATFDTQHLGMWWRYWVPRPGETLEETRHRFERWYMDQVKLMQKADILGHVHVVDGWGRGHTHLPAGEGINPVTTAIDYLKKKGYESGIISEAFGEAGGQNRQLTRTWEAFGSTIYHPQFGPMRPGAPATHRWQDIWQSYFGRTKTPYYIFGQYSPSEDWTLWSQVPLE